jgi:hypothetical protein
MTGKNRQRQEQKRNAGVPPLRFAPVGMTVVFGDPVVMTAVLGASVGMTAKDK